MSEEDNYNFSEFLGVKISSEIKENMKKVRDKLKEKYSTESHQVRVYILKGLREDGVDIQ